MLLFVRMSLPDNVVIPCKYTNPFNKLKECDKRAFCYRFCRQLFANEYFRLKSFDSIKSFEKKAVTLAKMGFYYSGDQKNGQNSELRRYITCFFCDFEISFTLLQFKSLDTNYVGLKHEIECQTEECRTKSTNIPISKPLKKFDIHLAAPQTLGIRRMFSFPSQTTLSTAELSSLEVLPTICFICRVRPLSVIYRPCGCVVACDKCNAKIPYDRCLNCNSVIIAYAKVFIP